MVWTAGEPPLTCANACGVAGKGGIGKWPGRGLAPRPLAAYGYHNI